MLIEFLGTLLFLISVMGALGVVIALIYRMFTKRRRLVRVVLISSAVWLVAYYALLGIASLLTSQQGLEAHQERCFDKQGFRLPQAAAS